MLTPPWVVQGLVNAFHNDPATAMVTAAVPLTWETLADLIRLKQASLRASAASGLSNEVAPQTVDPLVVQDVTVMASGAHTTTQTSADLANPGAARSCLVVLDLTVNAGTAGSITIAINRDTQISLFHYHPFL